MNVEARPALGAGMFWSKVFEVAKTMMEVVVLLDTRNARVHCFASARLIAQAGEQAYTWPLDPECHVGCHCRKGRKHLGDA